jgi:AcrR family transcriptional regulator
MTSPAPPRSAGRPRSQAPDEAILRTTVRLLIDQGYDAMSIEGVAAAAGVGKATIYRRYPNKRDLVVAAISAMAASVEPAPDSGSARDDMLALLRGAMETMLPGGLVFAIAGTLLVKEREEPTLIELFRAQVIWPRFEAASAILRRGIERGELRPDLRPDVVLPMLMGAIVARHLAGFPEEDGWLEPLFDTLWEGIATRGASRGRSRG